MAAWAEFWLGTFRSPDRAPACDDGPGAAYPVVPNAPFLGDLEVRARLDELWAYKRGLVELMQSNRKAETAVSVQVPVITALGNNAERQFVYPRFVYRGTRNHGLVFLESPLISARAL